MKQQTQEQIFQTEIKFLHKKFHILDKPNTKILYDFCQFDIQRAYKVLSIGQTLRNPIIIIQNLIKNPQKSEEYIDSLIKRYDNQIGQKIDIIIHKTQNKIKSKEIIKIDFQFFENVPEDMIGTIMSFLDPYSLKKFTFTNKEMYKIGKAQALSELYKEICKIIFPSNVPYLPVQCRFWQVKKFVQEHPEQYFPYYSNFKNAVNNNLRQYIWKILQQDLKVDKQYYKSFGSYENLFLKCPRVNLNGYYMCKHKYVKIGQKDATHFITPIHIVYYYRYMRFLEDGSVIYHVCNKKIKSEDLLKFLSSKILQTKDHQFIIGEFMQFKNILFLKAVKDNTVFSYQFQINSTQNKISNQLKVINYKLELIDNSYMTQTLFLANPHKEDLLFEYFYSQQIKSENTPKIQASSL